MVCVHVCRVWSIRSLGCCWINGINYWFKWTLIVSLTCSRKCVAFSSCNQVLRQPEYSLKDLYWISDEPLPYLRMLHKQQWKRKQLRKIKRHRYTLNDEFLARNAKLISCGLRFHVLSVEKIASATNSTGDIWFLIFFVWIIFVAFISSLIS